MRDDIELAILLSPSLLIVLWTFILSDVVRRGVPLSALWGPFWIATFCATALGAYLALRDRVDTIIWLPPIMASAVIMAPYLINGLATFPGSWFWDGFAYMASGESLWLYPRHESAAGLELFYQFGHKFAQVRYISAATISIFKGVFPLAGDAQESMGYFLLLCIFTLASSCYFLARVALPGRQVAQVAFVVLGTVSGPVLNLVWANNFDHLLAMSISPIIIGLALSLRWDRRSDAVLLAAFVAAEFFIYTEMAALFAMPACLILLVRLFRERATIPQAKSAATAIAVFVIAVMPEWYGLVDFFKGQINAVSNAATALARPGNGYFPTFFTPLCGPGAWLGMFAPYSQCAVSSGAIVKLGVSIGAAVVLVLSFSSWRRNTALLVSAAMFIAAASYFLIVQRYDYGAFKILETAWVPLLLVCAVGTMNLRPMLRGATAIVAVALIMISVGRVVSFDQWASVKSISRFSELQKAIPRDAIVDVRIDGTIASNEDSLAFEWATYYLRNHRAVFSKGEFVYYPATEFDKSQDADRVRSAEYVLTGKPLEARPVWSNGTYYLYAASTLAADQRR